MSATEAHVVAPSFDRDGAQVHDLAIQSGPSKPYMLGQAQTWLNAFCLFRKLENHIGLPPADKERERQCYFVLLSVLISAGEYLEQKLSANDKIMHEFTGVSLDGFKGCVDMLRDSMVDFKRQITADQLEAIKQRAFDGQAAA